MTHHIEYHLSRVTSSPQRLQNTYGAHRAFWRAYGLTPQTEGAPQPFRFRQEPIDSRQKVAFMVQSATKPDWSKVDDVDVQTKAVRLDLNKASRFAFRLGAVVQRRCRSQDGRAITLPVRNPADIERWMHEHAAQAGFDVMQWQFNAPELIQACVSNGRGFNLNVVRFDGELQVTDVEAFSKAILHGIGPKPALGMGLLTVIPL